MTGVLACLGISQDQIPNSDCEVLFPKKIDCEILVQISTQNASSNIQRVLFRLFLLIISIISIISFFGCAKPMQHITELSNTFSIHPHQSPAQFNFQTAVA
jgi:hypothetical protein